MLVAMYISSQVVPKDFRSLSLPRQQQQATQRAVISQRLR